MRSKKQRGGAVVELAVIFPLLALLFFGLIDAGRAMLTYHTLTHASEAAVRFAAVRSRTSSDPATAGRIRQRVLEASSGLEDDKVLVNTTWTPGNVRGGTVTVRVRYGFSPITPFVPWDTIDLIGASESRISN
jgi:Flp pilus assembly protein TadG